MKSDIIKNTTHYVFESDEEFRDFFTGNGEEVPEIVENWRDGQIGDWVRSDDGCIVQILRRAFLQHYKDVPNGTAFQRGMIGTIVGTFIIRDNIEMDTDFNMHPSRYSFGKKHIEFTGEKRWTSKVLRLSSFHMRFIAFLLSGSEPWKAVCMAAMKRYSKQYAVNTSNFLLRQPVIMEEITKQIDAAAQELGLDHRWVLERLKDISDRTEDDAVKRLATKDIGTAIGTFGRSDKNFKMLPSGGFNGFGGVDILDADVSDIRRPILPGATIPQLDISTVNRRIDEFLGDGFNPETDKF